MKWLLKGLLWAAIIIAGLCLQFTPFAVLLVIPFVWLSVKRNLTAGVCGYLACYLAYALVFMGIRMPWGDGEFSLGIVPLVWGGICLFPMLTAVGVLRARRAWRNSVLSIALAFILSILAGLVILKAVTGYLPVAYLSWGISGIIERHAGNGGFTDYLLRYMDMYRQYAQQVAEAVSSGNLTSARSAALTQEEANLLLEPLTSEETAAITEWLLPAITETASSVLPLLIMYISLLGGAVIWVVSVAVLRKSGCRVVKLPEFSMWSLTKSFTAALFGIAVIGLVLALLGVDGMDVVWSASIQLLLVLYRVQCGAFIAYLLKRTRLPGWLRVIIVLAVMLMGGYIAALVGMVDHSFSIRKFLEYKRTNGKGPMPPFYVGRVDLRAGHPTRRPGSAPDADREEEGADSADGDEPDEETGEDVEPAENGAEKPQGPDRK